MAEKVEASGHVTTEKVEASGHVTTEKVEASGHVTTEKVEASGHVTTEKVEASGHVTTEKVKASGHVTTEKVEASGHVTTEKVEASEDARTEKIHPNEDDMTEKVEPSKDATTENAYPSEGVTTEKVHPSEGVMTEKVHPNEDVRTEKADSEGCSSSDDQQALVMRAAEKGLSNLAVLALQLTHTYTPADVSKMAAARGAALVTACLEGHLEVARTLVERCHASLHSRCDVTVEGSVCPGVTPLWAASCNGSLDLVRYLVQKGASVNMTSLTQSSPLRVAAFDNRLAVVKFLVEKGADVNSSNSVGLSVLITACSKQRTDIVSHLLDHGADVNYSVPDIEGSNFAGFTALHSSATVGDVEMCKLLLAHGATISRDCHNETPLLTAARLGHQDLVTFMLDTPDCSRDDTVDALGVLGTVHWGQGDLHRCLSLWQRAMEERHRAGKSVLKKREADAKVLACTEVEEVQTLEELEELDDIEEFGVQCWLITDRVLGKTNPGTTGIIKHLCRYHVQDLRFDQAVAGLLHALDSLDSVQPFQPHTANLYDFLLYVLVVSKDYDALGFDTVTFTHRLISFKRAWSDFMRGDSARPANPSELWWTSRELLLKFLLHSIALLRQTEAEATPGEKREFSETVTSFVRAEIRGEKGDTPLHLACRESTSEAVRQDENCKRLIFPSQEVVQVLLEAGCDVFAQNEAGETTLQVAKMQNKCDPDVITMLTSAGAPQKD